MILTASTVKDTSTSLSRFVERNLANGVDHLVVFVDDADRRVVRRLRRHPHVTVVAADEAWWHGKRPVQLNARQRINANVARVLLAPFASGAGGPVEWLFHIDADEVLLLDRPVIDTLPADVDVVRALPWEAVSRWQWRGDRVTHFKRLLDSDELRRAHEQGLLVAAGNGSYFHGHLEGKSAIRPRMDRWHTLHGAHDVRQDETPGRTGDFARVLHYESWSGEEFVRKWTNILTSGGKVSFRPGREPVARALQEVLDADLSPRQARARFAEIYRATTEDPFDALLALGALEAVDPDAGAHRPASFDAVQAAELERVLAALAPENKWPFHTGRTARDLARLLDRVVTRLDAEDRALADRCGRAWQMSEEVLAAAAGNRQEIAAREAQAGGDPDPIESGQNTG
ncbi:glycosyltransferase family 2 protein [Nocardioides sp. R-C-SC26]|uniref:glycosyltransferase family 2 protein n=1 Tax=Nocardioides sp. R-C-SC26 TaxID=2870414 RepID=UPI001E5D9643|nr:glycosyltransferase family 2 protein [Nocardioides sp. R-C-SC26]